MTQTLVIMVKEPHPGRVKTRLGRSMGMTSAAWWFRHQVAGLLRRVSDPRWRLVLAVSPDRTGLQSRVWPSNIERVPQGNGSLGTRMARVLQGHPPGPVCIIGADIPQIDAPHIAKAFKSLRASDAVLGPAPDGGFWLVGLKTPKNAPQALFKEVRWSTHHAMSDTVATLKDRRVCYVDTLRDVDTEDDLRMTAQGARATCKV